MVQSTVAMRGGAMVASVAVTSCPASPARGSSRLSRQGAIFNKRFKSGPRSDDGDGVVMGRMANDLHGDAIDGVQGLPCHDLFGLAVGQQTAGVQRHQPIAETGGHVDVVNDDDDPEVELAAELLDEREHLHLMGHVQGGQRPSSRMKRLS